MLKEDKFGHSQLGGAGKVLETVIAEKLKVKVRSIELNTPQRCASHIASKTDIDESVSMGNAAVNAALNGETGKMMVFKRINSNPYECKIECANINDIANKEKIVPDEFITEDGNFVTQAFIDYALPLIQGELDVEYINGLPRHLCL